MSAPHPAESILGLATAYWASRCLHVVAEAGIADALGDAPETAAALAQKTGTNADALHRILRPLVARGIFTLRDGHFAHNDASRMLRTDSQPSLRGLARMMGLDFHWDSYREMMHSLKTGRSASELVIPEGLFPRLRKNLEHGRIFNEAMVGKSVGMIGPVLANYDFTPFRTIGDIGGGMGHLLGAILGAAPARGVLFELPEVIEQARSKPHARIEYVGGDFFRDALPACDLYVMMMVLHDWSDEDCVCILQNIAKTAPAGARLLLVEAVIDETKLAGFAIDLDIEMLTFAFGRERTEAQWRTVVEQGGFQLSSVRDINGLTGLVEASRA
ncbi:MAG: methyltransferase [Steroidobacteraceae bacterium]